MQSVVYMFAVYMQLSHYNIAEFKINILKWEFLLSPMFIVSYGIPSLSSLVKLNNFIFIFNPIEFSHCLFILATQN